MGQGNGINNKNQENNLFVDIKKQMLLKKVKAIQHTPSPKSEPVIQRVNNHKVSKQIQSLQRQLAKEQEKVNRLKIDLEKQKDGFRQSKIVLKQNYDVKFQTYKWEMNEKFNRLNAEIKQLKKLKTLKRLKAFVEQFPELYHVDNQLLDQIMNNIENSAQRTLETEKMLRYEEKTNRSLKVNLKHLENKLKMVNIKLKTKQKELLKLQEKNQILLKHINFVRQNHDKLVKQIEKFEKSTEKIHRKTWQHLERFGEGDFFKANRINVYAQQFAFGYIHIIDERYYFIEQNQIPVKLMISEAYKGPMPNDGQPIRVKITDDGVYLNWVYAESEIKEHRKLVQYQKREKLIRDDAINLSPDAKVYLKTKSIAVIGNSKKCLNQLEEMHKRFKKCAYFDGYEVSAEVIKDACKKYDFILVYLDSVPHAVTDVTRHFPFEVEQYYFECYLPTKEEVFSKFNYVYWNQNE